MTKTKTSSFEKGNRCRICTGCGRCFGTKPVDAVCEFNGGLWSEFGGRSDGEKGYLIAADIGTTTIAMQLRRLCDGRIEDTYTCINPQRNFGADVLSRIEAAGRPEAKAAMQEAVRDALKKGVEKFTAGEKEVCGLSIAANTTMVHLLMGLDVSGLGKYPFLPQTLSEIRTRLLGLDTVVLPGISTFVGADIVAGIYALSMALQENITLLLDLGTNGEMVLGNKDRLIAAATAAGPAFEGNTDCYGADLMHLTAKLLEEGLLDASGLLKDPYFEEGIDVGGVHITQQYIRQLQMAKSAINTGIHVLCKKYGLQDFGKIERVYLAGGMGYYLDASSAAAIGLIPAALADRTVAVGNAALEGAFIYGRQIFAKGSVKDGGQGAKMRGAINPLVVEDFNLADEPDFSGSYIDGMELRPYL